MTEAVKIRLFDREYGIRGRGNKEYVEKLADFIRKRADEIKEHTDAASTLDVVILTLLNITDEMFQYKQAKERTTRELEEKADKLIEAIDRAD